MWVADYSSGKADRQMEAGGMQHLTRGMGADAGATTQRRWPDLPGQYNPKCSLTLAQGPPRVGHRCDPQNHF